jgi:hypothetical protein
LTSLTLMPWKPLNVYLGNDYVPNVFSTAFGKAEYTHQLTEEWKLQLGLQHTDQRSVGNAQIGDFNTWNMGFGARLSWRGSPSARPRTSWATAPTFRRPMGPGPATCP